MLHFNCESNFHYFKIKSTKIRFSTLHVDHNEYHIEKKQTFIFFAVIKLFFFFNQKGFYFLGALYPRGRGERKEKHNNGSMSQKKVHDY